MSTAAPGRPQSRPMPPAFLKLSPMCRARVRPRVRRFTSCRPTSHRSGPARRRLRPIAPRPARWSAIRTAVRRRCARPSPKRYGLSAERIVCGAGSDELLQLLAMPISARATRQSTASTAFWCTRSPSRPTARRRHRAGKEPDHGCGCDYCGRDATDPHSLPGQPEQSDGHLHSVQRGEAPACRACPDVLLVLDAAYAEFVRPTTMSPASRW
jgi:histidinol-phosphate/aromatic aminotransferase/cobyric acid decarboxylase-like protein